MGLLRFLFILLLCGFALLLSPGISTYADQPPTQRQCQGAVILPHQIVIDCKPGYKTDHNTVVVYTSASLDLNKSWSSQLNYEDASWVFYEGEKTKPSLIITFERRGQKVRAKLFDDKNGDGVVAASYQNQQVVVTEGNGLPTVIVEAKNSWWLPNGVPNFNLDIWVDGPVIGMIDTASTYFNLLKTDGKIDLVVHIRDLNGDGRPDYEWRQAYPPLSENDGFYHTSVMVNPSKDEPKLEEGFFWPFLGSGATEFIRSTYGSLAAPPINFDWKQSKITHIVESVASRTSPHNYFIYSIRRIEEGKLNDVNFESPFAFYQFSPQAQPYPDLALRVVNWPKGDFSSRWPVQQIDFSWRQRTRNLAQQPDWDYRLGLLGHNTQQGTITLPEFSLNLTPYTELPHWVTSNSWDYASFVAREEGPYLSSEGIYEWSTLEGVVTDIFASAQEKEKSAEKEQASAEAQRKFVMGETAQIPDEYYRQIRPGLRGEFRPGSGPPNLYISVLDGKLHLRGATYGIWQLDETSALQYADLDQDGYFDQWLYLKNGLANRQVELVGKYLIYSDEDQIIIRETQTKPAVFDGLPPTNPQSWQNLHDQLNANNFNFEPTDFVMMMQKFTGPEIRITKARLQDYQPMGKNGFNFVLELKSQFQLIGADWLNVARISPGKYMVSYDEKQHWLVKPFTPVEPDVRLNMSPTLNNLELSKLSLSIDNKGFTNLAGATLEVWATSEQQAIKPVVISTTLSLTPNQTQKIDLDWAPTLAGQWTLTPKLKLQNGQTISYSSSKITVQNTSTVSVTTLAEASGGLSNIGLILTALLAFTFIGALLLWQQIGSISVEPDNRESLK